MRSHLAVACLIAIACVDTPEPPGPPGRPDPAANDTDPAPGQASNGTPAWVAFLSSGPGPEEIEARTLELQSSLHMAQGSASNWSSFLTTDGGRLVLQRWGSQLTGVVLTDADGAVVFETRFGEGAGRSQ